MKYSEEQWIKCKWRIDKIGSEELCYERYSELSDVFKPILTAYREKPPEGVVWKADELIRYVVLTYHRYSPFAINEQNIIKRKIDVCGFLGFNVEKEYVQQIIANQNRFVGTAAIHFLKQENSIDWFELQQYLEAYYQIMQALTDDSEDNGTKTIQDIAKIKLGIVKEMKQIKSEIETLSSKVFADDSDLLNFVERYRKDEEDNFAVLSPEDYIRSKRTADANS